MNVQIVFKIPRLSDVDQSVSVPAADEAKVRAAMQSVPGILLADEPNADAFREAIVSVAAAARWKESA